jgi:hypothetical protein
MGNTNSSNDIKNFFNNDVKNAASSFGSDLEKMMMAPSNLMNSLAGSLNSPLLLPAVMIIGGIVVVQMVSKK